MARVPKVFISYSWDDDAHKSWVKDLAARLRRDWVETVLDQWHVVPGDRLPAFMEGAVRDSDYVLIICTPKYAQKSNARSGGVGYEGDIMAGEVVTERTARKFIPVLRSGDTTTAIPSWLKGISYIDLRGTPYAEQSYQDLVATLRGTRPDAPCLGPGSAPDVPPDEAAMVSVAGLVAILDELAILIKDVKYPFYAFGERRRVLRTARRLHGLVKGAILRNQKHLSESLISHIDRFTSLVHDFISEADYVLPQAHEDRYTRDQESLKEYELRVHSEWRTLKDALLQEPGIAIEFEEIKSADTLVWRQLGFPDINGYFRYVSPHTEDIVRDAGETELMLLEDIITLTPLTFAALQAEGYSRGTIAEILNALMRDEYVTTEDWRSFNLTSIGKRVVNRLLQKKRKAGQP